MENLITKIVNKDSDESSEKERKMNKQIEKVFELESFQKMVENSDRNSIFADIQSTKSFISQSKYI